MILSLKKALFKIRSRPVIGSIFALSIRALFQTIIFMALARLLGPEEFGVYSSTFAFVAFLSPFVELGGFSLIVRDITTGKNVNTTLGESLRASFIILPAALILLIFLWILLFNIKSLAVLIFLAVAEFIGGRLINWSSAVFTAQEKFWFVAIIELLSGLSKVISLYLLSLLGFSAFNWSQIYFWQNTFIGIMVFIWICSIYGWPSFINAGITNRISEGMKFSIGLASQNMYGEADKVLLRRMDTLHATGNYSVASKAIIFAYLPLSAYLNTTYPKFFSAATFGRSSVHNLCIKTIRVTAIYGLICVVLIFLFADTLTKLVGNEYYQAIGIVKGLSFFVLLQSLALPLGDALTAIGKQGIRSGMQFFALIINVILNLILIPLYSVYGSVIAAIASQILLLSLYLVLYVREISGGNNER